MSSQSEADDEPTELPYDIDEVMAAKRDNPGMFVSAWEADENDIDSWSKSQIKADPLKRFIVAAEKGELNTINEMAIRSKKQVPDSPHPTLEELLSATDRDGYTALHRAAYGGHLLVLKRLIQLGANLNSRTEDGWTPLHSAAFWNQLACVQTLVYAGADPQALTNSNQTPMHLAVSNNQGPETLIFLMSLPQTSIQKVRNKVGDAVEDLILRNTPYFELCHPFSQCATQLSR
ncbi:putative fetal globin-inducing factor [Fasciola hepatica]|uniref:Fetal globin-inducing factor n=1 Tax=Fasciola hepatica TaxID=6192 RepID=A0A4E0R184_FASHE|nr:putative fetal globin-inducing factor [Fasciola hepatica]